MTTVALSDLFGGFIGVAVIAVIAGIALYRYSNYRQMLSSSTSDSSSRCDLCGASRTETGTCSNCGLDADRIEEAGLDDHLDMLTTIGDIQKTLHSAHDQAGGRFGYITNIIGLIPGMRLNRSVTSQPIRDRLRDSSQDHLRALRRLSDELDDHSELTRQIEDPETGESIEEILMESFEVSDSLATGIEARFQQAFLPRKIQRDIDRLDRAREAIAADVRRRW